MTCSSVSSSSVVLMLCNCVKMNLMLLMSLRPWPWFFFLCCCLQRHHHHDSFFFLQVSPLNSGALAPCNVKEEQV